MPILPRTLKHYKIKPHSVKNEATVIVESIRDWGHILIDLVSNLTDQRRISFMFDNSRISKIKNTKIARWRLELSQNKYDVSYRPAIENPTADTFSRESLQFVHPPLHTVKVTAQNHILSCDDKSRFHSARTQRKEK